VYEVESIKSDEIRLLAYDLGGGTFDTSLVRITKPTDVSDLESLYGRIEGETTYSMLYTVLDTDGDSRLGGDDIDYELYKRLERKFLEPKGLSPDLVQKQDREKLILRMERIKKSGPGNYEISVDLKLRNGTKIKEKVFITMEDFVEATSVVYNKTKAKVKAVLERAGSYKIDGIVLVGGSTKSEIIKGFLRRDFPGVHINDALNPDEAVALGAAVKAKESKFGDKSIEVFDVLPLSIGVLSEGHVKPIIKKNQRVPYSSGHMFTTVDDNQEEIEVHVYQGNSALPEECLYLGTIPVKDIPKGKAGEVQIYISMTVDTNGLLKCSVETETVKKEVELVNLFGKQSDKGKLSANEKKVRNWRNFANRLDNNRARVEILAAVDEFEEGLKTAKEVQDIIRKYAEYNVEITKPTVTEDTIQLE
jgi:molecular chaperone DnaK